MSIEHCDNFSFYGSSTALLLNGVYAQITDVVGLPADPDGIDAGRVLQTQIGAGGVGVISPGLRYPLAATQNKVGICKRLWLSALPQSETATPIIATFRDAGNSPIAYVFVTTTGGLAVYNISDATTVRTTGPVITANGWWHIEMIIDCAAGKLDIYVEGVNKLAVTGHTYTGPVAQVSFDSRGDGNLGPAIYHKDFVVWNGAGTQNNSQLGSVLVTQLTPQTDVSLNWALNGGASGHAILSNVPPQDGVQYIDAITPPPSPYVASLTDLSASTTSVKAVMTLVRAAKTDGGDGSLQVGLISSPLSAPVTGLGANRPITTAQTYWRDVFELDPKTGLAWLPAAVNAMNMQINRTA